jgi:hypothetical protein
MGADGSPCPDRNFLRRGIPMKHPRTLLIAFCLLASTAADAGTVPFATPSAEQITAYWYDRGAEISRYSLEQARYGEIHHGDAVLVFVTEEMNPSLQVKADRPDPGNVPVLKLNATRKFLTGIYPYSVMTSIFSPMETSRRLLPIKISFSAQEWCGHVYTQLNLRGDVYGVVSHSYFESEADRNFTLEKTVSEDALWTWIRISPGTLPQGRFQMIPGLLYSRLRHRPLEVQKVEGTLAPVEKKSLENRSLVSYAVRFPEDDRTLTIFFEPEFPHRIQGWEDTHRGLPHFGSRRLTTRAVRTNTVMTDYWNKHTNQDRKIRRRLGLRTP